jgi:hypothetical protein
MLNQRARRAPCAAREAVGHRAQYPHNSHTPAQPGVRTLCTRAARGLPCWPARTRKGRCSRPFLTSPPHPETSGEVRSGTAAKRVRSDQQGKPQSQNQSQTPKPYRRPAASICHAARGTRQHRPAASQPGTSGSTGTRAYRRPAASICHAMRGTRQRRQCPNTAGPHRAAPYEGASRPSS